MTLDARSTPVSNATSESMAAYEKAIEQFQTYFGDAVATLDAAIEQQPDFVMAHIFKACMLMTMAERRFADMAQQSLNAAQKVLQRANDREKAMHRAATLLVRGQYDDACTAFDEILIDYPRDVITLQTAHIFDFLRGDAVNQRNRVQRVLPHWSPAVPGYSYVLGLYAFGLEEANQYPEAEAAGREALSLQPRDPWAVHAVAHVMEMQGRVDEGVNWLESRTNDWSGDNFLEPHNWWHLALFHLDRERASRVLELYDSGIFGQPSDISMVLLDATSLLWRLYILGYDFGKRMEVQADYWQAKLDTEAGFNGYIDTQAMMAFAATGREGTANELLRRLESAARGDNQQAEMARIGLPVARGLQAFAREDYAQVISEIGPVRDRANRFGGSHAQRDFMTLTLIEAAIRGKRHALARHLLAERTTAKPASALGWRMLARAQ